MVIAAYVRVSTDDQTTDNQKTAIKEYVERSEDQQIKFYEDVISGSSRNRTALNNLLQDVRKGQISKVIVWRLDRLGRSLKHLMDILREFENRGVDFVSITQGFDTSTPQGRLFFQIVGAFAEFESRIISERTKEGLKRAKKQGKKLGRPKGSKDKKQRKTKGYYKDQD